MAIPLSEGDVSVDRNKTLYIDNLQKTGVLTDALTINSKTKIEGDVVINPSNTVYTDRITPHPDANAPMIVTVEGQMNVGGNVEMPKLICSYIEPTLGASVRITGDTLIEGDAEVRANKKLYVSEIRTASRNPNPIDNNITLVGNVRVQGNFRIGESNGAPDLTTLLAERPVNGAIAQLIAGTPSVDIPYLMPLATGETIGTNNKLDLKAPVKVQKSTDSTIIATFADSGPTFTGTMNTDAINITSGGLGTLALSTTGRITIGSNVQTPTLKIPGANANDSLTVQNSLGSIVARFQNDYACLLNGNTSVTGNMTVTGTLIGNAATFSGGIGVSGTATFTGPTTASNFTVSGLLTAPQLRIAGTVQLTT